MPLPIARYYAVIEGLKEAKEIGVRRIQVRLADRQTLEQLESSEHPADKVLVPLWEGVHDLLDGFESSQFALPDAEHAQAARELAEQKATAQGGKLERRIQAAQKHRWENARGVPHERPLDLDKGRH
jgi:hypothetical protein